MNRLLSVAPAAIAVVALVLVFVQRGEIRRLEQEVTRRLPAAGAGSPTGHARAGAPPSAPGAPVERRVAALEQTISRLFRMVVGQQGATRAAAAGEGDKQGAAPEQVAALREDVDALLTGEALATDKGRERLHDIIRQAQQKQWETWRNRRVEMRKQALRSRLRELADKTAIPADKLETLTTTLDAERDQQRAIFRGLRQGQKTVDQARAEARALRQSTDQQAKQLLDDKQFAEYEKMRQQGRGGGRGWMR